MGSGPLASFLLILGVTLSGECVVRASPSAGPADVFVVAQSLDDLVSLDPAEGFELSSLQAFTALYQRLVQPDRDRPSIVQPVLAASWTAGERSLTF
jgi:peptide/nickel transport system substrate-binding protein